MKIDEVCDIPYTISFVIRKRQQLDSLNDLPKDKRPPERMIWESPPEEIDDWLDRVFNKNEPTTFDFVISDEDIER